MIGTAALVQGVKTRLRAQGLTYRELARKLGLSEPTIKRDLARGTFSLKRLDRICEVLGVGVEDLLSSPDRSPITELTEQQEHALVSNPRLLVVTYLVVNDWKFADIIATFRLDANELIDVLLKLDRLKILDFRPPTRMRKLTARNFSWRKDGPVQAYFLQRVIPEFFNARFEALGDEMRFVGGTLSAASMLRLQSSLRRVAAEFEQLAHQDSRLPLEQRDGCSAILAFRRWEFSEFAKLRRAARPRRSQGDR
jgi:transcriptional regulator with XRE-family HTH domain